MAMVTKLATNLLTVVCIGHQLLNAVGIKRALTVLALILVKINAFWGNTSAPDLRGGHAFRAGNAQSGVRGKIATRVVIVAATAVVNVAKQNHPVRRIAATINQR